MASKTFLTLVDRVNPHVPGAPREVIRRHVRDAAINVCERTLAWRYHIPVYNLMPAVHEYAFSVPSNTEVHAIFAAIVNGSPLALLNLDEAIQKFPEWADLYSGESAAELWSETPSAALNEYEYDEETVDGITDFVLPDSVVADASTPQACTQIAPDRYIILPLPDGERDYQMRMIVALKPKRDATSMDAAAMNELEDVIVHRAVQNMCLLPNVPWTNPQLAKYHAQQYQFHINLHRARANLGNNRGSMSVNMQRWA